MRGHCHIGETRICDCNGHRCDPENVEQTPGYGHCIVRCRYCHRPGIRTFNPVHVTWEDEIPPTPGFVRGEPSDAAKAMIERSRRRANDETARQNLEPTAAERQLMERGRKGFRFIESAEGRRIDVRGRRFAPAPCEDETS